MDNIFKSWKDANKAVNNSSKRIDIQRQLYEEAQKVPTNEELIKPPRFSPPKPLKRIGETVKSLSRPEELKKIIGIQRELKDSVTEKFHKSYKSIKTLYDELIRPIDDYHKKL